MQPPTATLEKEIREEMNPSAPQSEQAEIARATAKKFTYATGSRPLEGYTIKRGVGHGGFGEVYFGTSDAGKEVALKLIRRNLEVELRGVKQCLNLKHPNLISLYDIREDESGDQWVIMEYVSGESLDAAIERHPNGMPHDEAMAWIRGICAGVAYLHDRGIVHRDLKPGNIFSEDGTVKIGDYGLAKFISCSRRSGQTESVGTVHYMAPEIANGRYGREIDTYAVGIILYEILTGNVPFDGESVGEVLMKHLTAEPNLDSLQEPFREIVRRALAKDPDLRLKNVGEMLAMLPGSGTVIPIRERVAPVKPVAADIPPQNILLDRASPSAEEPVLKAVREGVRSTVSWMRSLDLHPGVRIFIGVLIVLFLIRAADTWAGLVIWGGILYLAYYIVWKLALQPKPGGLDNSSAPMDSAAVAYDPAASASPLRHTQAALRRRLRHSWRDHVHQQLRSKPFRDKSSGLLGSMLMAALVSVLVSMVAPIVAGIGTSSEQFAFYLWVSLVGTLGSWAVLIVTKFSEGRIEDQTPMRSMLLVSGALVGAAAWALASMMMLGLPMDMGNGANDSLVNEMLGRPQFAGGTESFGTPGILPGLATFVVYFALVFVFIRWWRLAEYTRLQRFGLWSVAWSVLFAFILHFIWWFPQPSGMIVAGVIAVATQLSSPWLPPSGRRALTDAIEADMPMAGG